MDEQAIQILAEPDPAQAIREAMEPQRRQRGPVDKRNHLSLVELRHLLQLSDIPPRAWEAVSTMFTEYVQNRRICLQAIPKGGRYYADPKYYIDATPAPDDEEWLTGVRDWINTLFMTSQSVNANQAERMVRGMSADKEWSPKTPTSGVTGNHETGRPEAKKRGWLS
jgi:hypothetical protein